MKQENMFDSKKVDQIISNFIKRDFSDVDIADIIISPDEDFEGNEILKITVIYRGSFKKDAIKKTVSAVRKVRPQLEQVGEHAFPLFSFISQSDYGAGHRAAH